MNRSPIFLSIVFACASCGVERSDQSNQALAVDVNQPVEAPVTAPEAIRPGEPGGLPDDRTPVSEGAIDPTSAQGAGQVLQRFGGLLEQRKFADAYRLWSNGGRASGLSEPEFVVAYGKYAEIHSEVGAPGEPEGAAGSIYVDIPFRLYGRLQGGQPFNLVGPVTLRRVNEVPGSSEEQRRWHIERSGLQPRP